MFEVSLGWKIQPQVQPNSLIICTAELLILFSEETAGPICSCELQAVYYSISLRVSAWGLATSGPLSWKSQVTWFMTFAGAFLGQNYRE